MAVSGKKMKVPFSLFFFFFLCISLGCLYWMGTGKWLLKGKFRFWLFNIMGECELVGFAGERGPCRCREEALQGREVSFSLSLLGISFGCLYLVGPVKWILKGKFRFWLFLCPGKVCEMVGGRVSWCMGLFFLTDFLLKFSVFIIFK